MQGLLDKSGREPYLKELERNDIETLEYNWKSVEYFPHNFG